MKIRFIAVTWLLLASSSAWSSTAGDAFLNLKEAELWLRVIVNGEYSATYDEENDHTERKNRLHLTVEGTQKFKKYELPYGGGGPIPGIPGVPSAPPFPRKAPLVPDAKNFNITGDGGGDTNHIWIRNACNPDEPSDCQDFKQEGTENWHFETLNPTYIEEVVRDFEIFHTSENEPVRFRFKLKSPYTSKLKTYVAGSGVTTHTTRNYEVNETTSVPIENMSPNTGSSGWSAWNSKSKGKIEGELKLAGSSLEGAGHIVFPYSSGSGSVRESGTVEIYYKINPKPAPKKIQVNQALGRYKYIDEFNYVPASDFVAEKNTAVQVFFDRAFPVASIKGDATLEVNRNGSKVCTLVDGEVDERNNALNFEPLSPGDCGSWAAGTYKFVAKLKDAEEVLDHVRFEERRKLRILALPIRANYGGEVRSPGTKWKNGYRFMAQVYPVGEGKLDWTMRGEYDASGPEYDVTTSAGQEKLWGDLNRMGSSYNLVIGFIKDPIPLPDNKEMQGFTFGGNATVVSSSDSNTQTTVAHEVAHVFKVGDEYNGGSFNLPINQPPYGFAGRIIDTNSPVTASDPDVKPFSGGSGSLISENLHPFEPGWRGLLKDSMCFMGSGAAANSNWVSPAVWKHLYRSLVPTGGGAFFAQFDTRATTEPQRVIELSGWINKGGTVRFNLPWTVSMVSERPETKSGDYTMRAVDASGAVLAKKGFTPVFVSHTNPPRELEFAPFDGLKMPFPEGTVKFQVVDSKGGFLGELPVSAAAPSVAITAPAAGEEVRGLYKISWTGNDADSDLLFYKVEYSVDAQDWMVLAPRLTTTSLTQDFGTLPGGSQVRIRVTASDGINAVAAETAEFQVPIKAPEVTIEAPLPESHFKAGEKITFAGSAYDLQEGALVDATQLTWNSDRDGEIGRGASFATLRKLSPGRHVITFTARSRGGQVAQQSLAITVE